MSSMYQRLCKSLENQGLTQAELARMCGISKSSISQYCLGTCDHKQHALDAIATALGVDATWLRTGQSATNVPQPNSQRPTINISRRRLTALYDQLNKDGRSKAIAYLEDLTMIEAYRCHADK